MAGVSSANVLPLMASGRVAVSWHDGQAMYLGCKRSGPCDEVQLDLDLDPSQKRAFIKLRVSVGLRTSRHKTNVFFFVLPEHIDGIEFFCPGQKLPSPVHHAFIKTKQSKSIDEVLGIRLNLTEPGFSVAPKDLLIFRPSTRDSRSVLERLESVSAARELTIYFTTNSMPSPNGLETICELVKAGGLESIPGKMKTLYRGTGGRRISWDTSAPANPPHYEEIAHERPPQLTVEDHHSSTESGTPEPIPTIEEHESLSKEEMQEPTRKRLRSWTRDVEERKSRRATQRRAEHLPTEKKDLHKRTSGPQDKDLAAEVKDLRNLVTALSAQVKQQNVVSNRLGSDQRRAEHLPTRKKGLHSRTSGPQDKNLAAEVKDLRNLVTALSAEVSQQSVVLKRLTSDQSSIRDLIDQQAAQQTAQNARLEKLIAESEQRIRKEMTELINFEVERISDAVYEDMDAKIDDAMSQMSDQCALKIDDCRDGMKEKLDDDLRDAMIVAQNEIKHEMRFASATIQWAD